MADANRKVLPGFYLSLSGTLLYLGALVLLPLAACFIKAATLSPQRFWSADWSERARAAFSLTFGASFASAGINILLGLLVAWVLVSYEFPLKRLVDALIDLPLALPTAVASFRRR